MVWFCAFAITGSKKILYTESENGKMKHLLTIAIVAIVTVALNTILCTSWTQAQIPDWPGIFEPTHLLTLNIQMVNPADWNVIRYDMTFDIEVPALFWADGEECNKLYVSVRRKSGDALPSETDPFKISLKIDINEYVSGQKWHSLNKLSLENGDDQDVLSEGLACNLHHIASGPEGYGYSAYYANWVKLYVNGVYRGVYVNHEQRDKQFLRNRGLYVKDHVWLYKSTGAMGFELEVGDDTNPASPAVLALCYAPLVCANCGDLTPPGGVCPTPDDAKLVTDVNKWVNVQAMLALGAVNAFVTNTDSLFSHDGRNCYFLDFDDGSDRKRMYFPWDQDSVITSVNWNIYERSGGPTTWQQIIFGNPTFRSQYNGIMRDLLNGPLSEANIHAFLDMVEPVLTEALAADPYNKFGTGGAAGVQEQFNSLRDWISDRIVNVLEQVDCDEPPPPAGIILLQDSFEGAAWDGNWVSPHNWLKDTTTYSHGTSSAWANPDNNGYFTCDALDTSDATAIHMHFWFMKNNTDAAQDVLLYYYNGTNYNLIADLDTLGSDDVWLHYTNIITDSQYFVSNFRIRFDATPEKRENVWIDDIVVTKEIRCECNSANLDGINPVNLKDFAILAGDWQLTGPELVGDINRDLIVNFKDLFQIVRYWLSECSQP